MLGELLAEPNRKVILFWEWERMLSLAREMAQDVPTENLIRAGIGAAMR